MDNIYSVVALLLFFFAEDVSCRTLSQPCGLTVRPDDAALRVLPGTDVSLVCDASCLGPLSRGQLQWRDPAGNKIPDQGEGVRSFSVNYNRWMLSRLVLLRTEAGDSGAYTCAVTHNGRHLQYAAVVHVEDTREEDPGPRRGDIYIEPEPEFGNIRPVRSVPGDPDLSLPGNADDEPKLPDYPDENVDQDDDKVDQDDDEDDQNDGAQDFDSDFIFDPVEGPSLGRRLFSLKFVEKTGLVAHEAGNSAENRPNSEHKNTAGNTDQDNNVDINEVPKEENIVRSRRSASDSQNGTTTPDTPDYNSTTPDMYSATGTPGSAENTTEHAELYSMTPGDEGSAQNISTSTDVSFATPVTTTTGSTTQDTSNSTTLSVGGADQTDTAKTENYTITVPTIPTSPLDPNNTTQSAVGGETSTGFPVATPASSTPETSTPASSTLAAVTITSAKTTTTSMALSSSTTPAPVKSTTTAKVTDAPPSDKTTPKPSTGSRLPGKASSSSDPDIDPDFGRYGLVAFALALAAAFLLLVALLLVLLCPRFFGHKRQKHTINTPGDNRARPVSRGDGDGAFLMGDVPSKRPLAPMTSATGLNGEYHTAIDLDSPDDSNKGATPEGQGQEGASNKPEQKKEEEQPKQDTFVSTFLIGRLSSSKQTDGEKVEDTKMGDEDVFKSDTAAGSSDQGKGDNQEKKESDTSSSSDSSDSDEDEEGEKRKSASAHDGNGNDDGPDATSSVDGVLMPNIHIEYKETNVDEV